MQAVMKVQKGDLEAVQIREHKIASGLFEASPQEFDLLQFCPNEGDVA